MVNAGKRLERGIVRQTYGMALLFGGCLLVAGCGSDVATVSGTVTFGNEPVAEGVLRFLPVGETPGRGAAVVIKDGSYLISSEKTLAPGEYRVSITASRETGRKYPNPEPMPGDPKMLPEIVQYIPASFNAQSKLRVKLEAGDNKHDFQLTDK